MKEIIRICPELAGFSKEFRRAMRDEAHRIIGKEKDRGNYWFSELTFGYCGLPG